MCIILGRETMSKKRINLTLERDLLDFAKIYAQEQRSTVSELVNQFLLNLKRSKQGDSTTVILSDPDFEKSLLETVSRIRSGKVKWHKYDEVFK